MAELQNPPATLSVIDAIYNRRSVRDFKPQPVDEATIRTLIDAAIHAPTAMHQQPWSFVIVHDQSLLDGISETAKAMVRADAQKEGSPQAKEKLDIVNDPGFHVFYNASTLLLICSKIPSGSAIADCWLAAQNVLLTATAKGLGTCIVGFSIGALNTPEWKAKLQIPADTTVVAPILIGIPATETPVVPRTPADILAWK
ncbi:MAG: nitroreductase [Alphaproteobacteria bacterium]|nr:nitroreductase [Alphaproteobacteria bacterium]